MQKYISWGFCQHTCIDPTVYVFISGLGEFLGMFFFIFLLVGLGLNFSLKHSKGKMKPSYGWVVIAVSIALIMGLLVALGFQFAIFTSYYQLKSDDVFNIASLALNPAIVLAYILKGANYLNKAVTFYIPIGNGMIYLLMQLIGAMLGAFIGYLFFKKLIEKQKSITNLENCFYTTPVVKNNKFNFFNETIATFILVALIICIGYIFKPNQGIEKILIVGLIVTGIGYGLGGTTGYALNPFRDLGPRIVYYLIFNKQNKNLKQQWKYCYVPILAPILGSILAVIIFPGFLY